MKRRTVLQRLAAGAGSVVALAGTTTATTGNELPDLRGTDYRYRVTEAGLEPIEATGSFDTSDDCNVDLCCVCPDECRPRCECLTPC